MEGRCRRPRSPERQRPAARKVPVVYYLTRSRHLEHPHFVEVPMASPEGLYLRDVINHLNMVRGKGMAAMYSWSCKRSYKNGFVWHDLVEDDLVLPATDGEYVLKGSELVDESSSVQFYHGSNGNQKQQSRLKEGTRLPLPREASYPFSPPSVIVTEAKLSVPPQDEDDNPSPCRDRSLGIMSPELEPQRPQLPASGSASPAEFSVYKPTGCMDAATQTDDLGRRSVRRAPEMRKKSLSTDHDAVVREITEYRRSHPRRSAELQGISRELLSQCPTPLSIPSTRGKSESLESLIRADNATNSFRILEEDDTVVPTCPKLRPTNVLMQLITCGSLSVKDHENIGIVQAYEPRFPNLKFPSPLISRTRMMGELDYLSENPRLMGVRLEEKEYFSGSLVETKVQRDVPAERYSALKRSSSYNAERSGETLNCSRPDEDTIDTSRSRCLPRTPILSSFLHPKSDTLKSPVSACRRSSSAGQDCDLASGDGSRRFTDASAASARADSFRKEEKLVKIEES
ncbi:protein SOSEKI 3-like [Phragmites australis]|uniref:protein SOSEKI 3-like n=1 Tax=Phragmites australis TaxID=29695 RepID=UPI002D77EF83|nr:protein SOSEKI 3-like [Phragmites australis]XP_062214925.1 protein SOSEKI 3-like [Phragmites australis]XP_062214926.1 protein SOSEKI 3-like [Phragmites australis]XP_062214927.1 protein SOSEKI 3-like [Phragmites australis]XP_062214928.1 protein SOSEKI 3-like [Phragmites australis]XP_062214929.1 protein SOSEKI 3-like [Phragmites australis]